MSYQPPYRQGSSTNSLAIVSLVFGILAWCVLPFIGAIVAIICGHLARGEIRRAAPDSGIEGDGMAVTGMVLGYVQLALSALALLVVVVVLFGLAFSH
jgi:thiol:disulfide interchange protein